MIDINGMIHDHMSEDDVEARIRTCRVRPTHKARRGAGNWHELGTIPQFRRIFKEVNPHIFEPLTAIEVEAKKEEEEQASSLFLRRMGKLAASLLVIYILIGFGMQYSQRRLLEDDLRVILTDSQTKVTTLRNRVRFAIKQRGLSVPEANIHIIADPPNKHVSIRIDYDRTLLGIALHYQANREASSFNLPIEQLAQAADGDLELIGNSKEDVNRYRQEQAVKSASEKLKSYQGDPDTLKEREALSLELHECEEGMMLFDIVSADESGRLSYPKSIRVRDKEYNKEALQFRINQLKTKLADLDQTLAEQRARRLEAESRTGRSADKDATEANKEADK